MYAIRGVFDRNFILWPLFMFKIGSKKKAKILSVTRSTLVEGVQKSLKLGKNLTVFKKVLQNL